MIQIQIPHLEATPSSKQLVVDGKPFLMLAAELQNSSMTSAKYMKEVWPKLVDANVNTVLGCITWEQIEPEEGRYDFGELDKIIMDARQYGLRLILLWFGSFKNGLSTYTPAWVKKDVKRFPRAKLRKAGGELKTADVVSIFHGEAQKADAKTFSKLMEHVKEVDEKHSTVVMVQVENETGLLGDSRDGSAAANATFAAPVPEDLIETLSKQWESLRPELQSSLCTFRATDAKTRNTSWEAVFGKSKQTDELFMAYHYARYVEQVASAGKKVYPLPLYTNVWQNVDSEDGNSSSPIVAGGGGVPGDFPSGGGVIHVIDVWQLFAPSLDLIAPDIYFNEYSSLCAKYRHRNQPLFIPEQRRDEYGARRVWKAYGSYQAIGASPFGVDTLKPSLNPFKRHFGLLAQVSQHVLKAQRDDSSVGFYFDELSDDGKDSSPATIARFGPWRLLIQRSFVFGKAGPGSGLVIHMGDARFMLVGWGFQVIFSHEKHSFTGILKFEEKEVVDRSTGKLETLRMLNGDETRSGAFVIMPNEDPDYGGFPICVTIPSKTMIAECEVYALEDDEEA